MGGHGGDRGRTDGDGGRRGGIDAMAGVMRRPTRRRPGGGAVAASIAVHGAAIAVLLFSGLISASPQPEFRVYEVEIVSPPAARETPEPVVADPEPEVEEETPEPDPEPDPEPEPERLEPAPPEEPAAEPEPDPEPEPASEPEAREPTPSEDVPASPRASAEDSASGGEDLNVSLTGEEFPFPEYQQNIITQIHRYFRWNGRSDLEAEFTFVIHRDGSVSDLRVLRSSGDVAFDFEAMGAIEQAAKQGAFGPLPEGFQADRLPISFYFRPPR